jgi:hypothetical protein
MEVRMRVLITLIIAVLMGLFISCAGALSDNGGNPGPAQGPVLTLPQSLHGTAAGMRWWYGQPNGLGTLINTDFSSTSCSSCHVSSCSDCHENGGSGPVNQPTVCYGCHGRHEAGFKMGETDVHFKAGMKCSDCHQSDIHGDGSAYNSMQQEGAIDASCEGCHVNGTAPSPPDDISHTQHGDALSCEACHVSTVTTCYNCHIDSMIDDQVEKPYKPFGAFVILANGEDGKVRTVTYQSAVKGDVTFVAYGPYFGHSVSASGRSCGDCHNSARMAELKDTGKIVMTTWDATLNPSTNQPVGIVHAQGVIPFAPDNFEFQFVNYDKATGVWSPLKTVTDGSQWEYCTPLTDEQLEALGAK